MMDKVYGDTPYTSAQRRTRRWKIQGNGCRALAAVYGLWSGSSITGGPRRVGVEPTNSFIGA